MTDKFELILQSLEKKACLKQKIYRQTKDLFRLMREVTEELAAQLSVKVAKLDEAVVVECREVNEFEFHLKFSGDLLVFMMHSNVVTFSPDHVLFRNSYIQENPSAAYFGNIMVYNFMADSVKYNRLGDPGYLVARLLMNAENKFFLEGTSQLQLEYSDISKNEISREMLKNFIETTMITAIENDLIAPPYQNIQVMLLEQKYDNQMGSGVQKVGFQMKVTTTE